MVRRMAHRGTSLTPKTLALALLFATSIGACATGTEPAQSVDGGITPEYDSGTPGDPDAAIDACAGEPCFAGVECTDVADGYECADCPAGLEGDGESCTDIDGCASSPCFGDVECTDVAAPGDGATCGACPDGFFGNGVVCTDVDACDGEPCFPGVTCVDNTAPEEGFVCGTCPTGFEGDGFSCTDIDECAGSPCFGDIECTDAVAPQTGFTCGDCPPGTTGDGEDCDLLCEAVSSLACGGQLSTSNDGVGSSDLVDAWECSTFTHTGPEIVYSFTPNANGIATISLTGLTADLDLMVIEDSSVGGLCDPADSTVCVPNGNSNGAGTNDEEVRLNATLGTTYYIIVDGFSGATSNFTLRVRSATEDFLLNEVAYGGVDYVEIRNHGACDADFAGLGLLHKASLASAPQTFTFPSGSMVPAGAVMRWVESGVSSYLPNEIDAGESILDIPSDPGSTALCNGACDASNCTNLLDYVERDDNTSDTSLPGGPACATFESAPVNSAGQTGEVSLRRAAFTGVGGPFQAADWTFGVTTRD
tara:strand:+ start:31312 stop:32916 length:1605 start_codon:yes stop_codon:yes gene_type:complete